MIPSINGSKCPFLVEDYKNHLRARGDQHVSFSTFCRQYNIRIQSANQWLRRHGLSVEKLRYEIMSEMLENNTWISEENQGEAAKSGNSSGKRKTQKSLKGLV